MRLLTADASVLLKWYLRTGEEDDLSPAAAILVGLRKGDFALRQPPHTLLEVAAVLVRERPSSLGSDLAEIKAILAEAVTLDAERLLPRALQLSLALRHHLFDTLYHAAALETGATLLTADRRYYDKARHLDNVTLLEDLRA